MPDIDEFESMTRSGGLFYLKGKYSPHNYKYFSLIHASESIPQGTLHALSIHIPVIYEPGKRINIDHLKTMEFKLWNTTAGYNYLKNISFLIYELPFLAEQIFWNNNDIEEDFENNIIHFRLAIQIEATRLDRPDDSHALLVTTRSTPMIDFFPRRQNIIQNAWNEWLDDLQDQQGYTEYMNYFHDLDGLYTITRINVVWILRDTEPEYNLTGGCENFKLPVPKSFSRGRLISAKGDDNICLWWCIAYYIIQDKYDTEHNLLRDLKVSELDIDVLAQELRNRFQWNNEPVSIDEACSILTSLKYSFSIYTIQKNQLLQYFYILRSSKNLSLNDIVLLIWEGHYYIIKQESLTYNSKCLSCKRWFSSPNHKCVKCNVCKSWYITNHTCKGPKKRKQNLPTLEKKKQKLCPSLDKNIWFADLETFTHYDGTMTVYSSAIVSIEDLLKFESKDISPKVVKCEEYIGEGGFDKFMKHILSLNGVVIFFNGSRFDLFFILQWIVTRKLPIKNMIRCDKSGKIMSLNINGVRFWDFYLFTMSSLDSTTKSFNVPDIYRKKKFDHSLIKNWKSVEKYKEEIIYYNAYDVISLGIAFIIFSQSVQKLYNFNCLNAITLSNMAFEIWRESWVTHGELKQIYLPSIGEYNFMRRALYGGRCCPQQLYFKSKDYNLDYESITDYLVYLDACSLYPYSSVIGIFPYGSTSWVDPGKFYYYLNYFNYNIYHGLRCNNTDDDIKKSFFEVDVYPPTDIYTGFLFSRDNKGMIRQDLNPIIKHVYDGLSLLEACELGYKVTKIYSIFKYASLKNLLKGYMTHTFKQKSNAPKTSVDYSLHKLLMNGLTGKMNQILRDVVGSIYYDDSYLSMNPDNIMKFDWILSTQSEIVGAWVNMKDSSISCSKPLAIGVNILSTSRVVMSKYLRFLNGYKDPNAAMLYGDTDSIIIRSDTYLKSKTYPGAESVYGTDLGLLCEEWPGGKIIKAVFLAPKTYCLEIKTKDKYIWYVTAKGIPKGDRQVDIKEYFEKYDRDVDQTIDDLTKVCFSLFTRKDELLQTRDRLNMPFFEAMALDDCYCIVHYGSIKKSFIDKSRGGLIGTIELDMTVHRSINKERWWDKKKRIYENPFNMTPPSGFK